MFSPSVYPTLLSILVGTKSESRVEPRSLEALKNGMLSVFLQHRERNYGLFFPGFLQGRISDFASNRHKTNRRVRPGLVDPTPPPDTATKCSFHQKTAVPELVRSQAPAIGGTLKCAKRDLEELKGRGTSCSGKGTFKASPRPFPIPLEKAARECCILTPKHQDSTHFFLIALASVPKLHRYTQKLEDARKDRISFFRLRT